MRRCRRTWPPSSPTSSTDAAWPGTSRTCCRPATRPSISRSRSALAPTRSAGDVKRGVLAALDTTTHLDGTHGFFHPDRFTFGTALERSAVEAAIQEVPGVDGVLARALPPARAHARVHHHARRGAGRAGRDRARRQRPQPARARLAAGRGGGRQVSTPVCPCDVFVHPRTISNPAGLPFVHYRVGEYPAFRRALLRALPAETALADWHAAETGDLALQLVEWWAYLADVLTFYNERAIQEVFLRTAVFPEDVRRIIRLLGYRPRPGIGATGVVAALTDSTRPFVVPRGFAIEGESPPGQAAQIFELDEDVSIGTLGRRLPASARLLTLPGAGATYPSPRDAAGRLPRSGACRRRGRDHAVHPGGRRLQGVARRRRHHDQAEGLLHRHPEGLERHVLRRCARRRRPAPAGASRPGAGSPRPDRVRAGDGPLGPARLGCGRARRHRGRRRQPPTTSS